MKKILLIVAGLVIILALVVAFIWKNNTSKQNGQSLPNQASVAVGILNLYGAGKVSKSHGRSI